MFQDGYDGDEDGVSKKRQDEEQNRRRSQDVKVNGNVEEDAQDIVGGMERMALGTGTRMKRTRKMRMRMRKRSR
jgi:isopentenyl phosphate kinase